MSKMRKQFEQLPEIAKAIDECDVYFAEEFDCYLAPSVTSIAAAFANGAWYAYQEQQKRIDALYESRIDFVEYCCKIESSDYVLVPKEPTPKMIDATWNFDEEIQDMSHNSRNEFIYNAMIAAAEAESEV